MKDGGEVGFVFAPELANRIVVNLNELGSQGKD
jgi:hypothetical protein